MAYRSCMGVVLLCLVVLASSAVPKNPRKKPANPPPRAPAADVDRDAEITNSCPDDGFFADAEQCDKYYECRNGEIIEKLCPDGMVFNDYSPEEEKCDLPYNIDCSQRPKLQTPQPTLHCPRLHGYFSHEDPKECGKFYFCVDGKFNMITCPDGLVYNDKTGICTWPDEAKKKGCGAADVFHFDCPAVNETFGLTHPRYADPEDCQFFYVCINGNTPRRSGCKLGQAFDDVNKKCEWARKVPECADWYKGQLTDAQLDALENPPTVKPKPSNSQPSRRKPQRPGMLRFECPPVNETFGLTHPRYADPDDCQYFYYCINGNKPRRSGCKLGQAFDDVNKRCEWVRNVPDCADWYKGQLTDEQLDDLENLATLKSMSSSSQPSQRNTQRPGKSKALESSTEE